MDIIIEAFIWIIIGALPGFYVFFIRGYDTRLGAMIGAGLGLLVGVAGIRLGVVSSGLSTVVIIMGAVGAALLLLPKNAYDGEMTVQRRMIIALGGILIMLFLMVGFKDLVFFERSIDPGIFTIIALLIYAFLIPRGLYTDNQSKVQRTANLAYALTVPTVLIVLGIVIFPVVWNVIFSIRKIEVNQLQQVQLFDLSEITLANFESQGGIRFDTVGCERDDSGACTIDTDGNIVYESARRTIENYRGWREQGGIQQGESQLTIGVRNPDFYPMIFRTIGYTLGSTIMAILFGLMVALLVREAFPGRAIFRGFVLFPYIAPVISVAFVWQALLKQNGLVNGILGTRTNFLGENSLLPLFMVILFQTWRYFPFAFLFLLARIQAIPEDMYEAAKVDGATPVQRLWFITLPQLRAVVGTLFLLRFIWTFNKFDDVFLLTGAIKQTKVIPIQIYESLFIESSVGEASAVAVVMAAILAVVLLIYFRYFLVDEA